MCPEEAGVSEGQRAEGRQASSQTTEPQGGERRKQGPAEWLWRLWLCPTLGPWGGLPSPARSRPVPSVVLGPVHGCPLAASVQKAFSRVCGEASNASISIPRV